MLTNGHDLARNVITTEHFRDTVMRFRRCPAGGRLRRH